MHLGVDGGSLHGNGDDVAVVGEIKGEVVGITLMHDLHAKIGTVDNVGPGVDDTSLGIDNRLVEIKAVEVEGHGGDTHRGQPDTNDRPGGEEEVESTGVVERGVLEDKTAKVSMGGDDVVSLLLLAELVAKVGGLVLGGLADEGRGDQRAVHGREEGTAEDAGHTLNDGREDIVAKKISVRR